MDILGLFDGLFGAISAAFSGKQVEPPSEKTTTQDKKPRETSSQTARYNKDAAQQDIKQAREKSNKTRSCEKELR